MYALVYVESTRLVVGARCKQHLQIIISIIMEEAIADLHNAIHLALSLNPRDFSGGDDLLQNGVVPAESSSTTESRISSLSGSMIEQSQRSNSALHRLKSSLYNNNAGDGLTGGNNNDSESVAGGTWQRHCLSTAKNVENALSNYELALLSMDKVGRGDPIYFIGNGSHQTSIVDLLVAALTSVIRHLMKQCGNHHHRNGMMGSTTSNTNFAMEQSCFTASCISANMLMKWFCHSDTFNHDIPLLEERHIGEMIEEVAIASADDLLSQFVEPIVTVVNSAVERQRICDGEGYFFPDLSAKDGLLLATSLVQRFICQPLDNTEIETSSHISLFVSTLLEHFHLVLAEAGREKFESWADAFNEYMERNLNDEEIANIPALVSQYHVQGIETALALLENVESLIESSEESGNVEGIVVTVQDTIRAIMIATSTTETMESLGIEQNPEIRVLFGPLVASFIKFILSGLQQALDVLRKINCSHDIEGICIIVDDLLFRLCCTTSCLEFFKSGGTGEEEEALVVVLLRAMSAGCIQSKAKALLDLAAESARNVGQDDRPSSAEVSSKRQKFNSSLSYGGDKASSLGVLQNNAPNGSTMIDAILCCLSLSQRDRGHTTVEQSHIEEVSCITSALMFSDASTEEVSNDGVGMLTSLSPVDPLNPWHSLQLKPIMQLVEDEHSSNNDESTPMMESLIAYTSALSPCADISA